MISAIGDFPGAMLRAGQSVGPSAGFGDTGRVNAISKAAGADFGAALEQLAAEAVDTLKAGEAAATLGVRGQMATQDVVEAVMAAEQTLQAAIAVRDKVVAAYQELSRMAI